MFSAQACAFLAGTPAGTGALTGCPKPATRWRSGPIQASESHGNVHWRDLLFSPGGNPLEKRKNQREQVWGTGITITAAPQKHFLSENTWSLLGWPAWENTGCDGNRIFQLNISVAFACSDPVTRNSYCTQDPNSFPCNFLDWKALCYWKQESVPCTLHISQYIQGDSITEAKTWKAKDGTGRKQSEEKKLWLGVFSCSTFSFHSEKQGKATCRN